MDYTLFAFMNNSVFRRLLCFNISVPSRYVKDILVRLAARELLKSRGLTELF